VKHRHCAGILCRDPKDGIRIPDGRLIVNGFNCLIELKTEARALSFAHSVGLWLDHLT